MNISDIINNLNENQKEAVVNIDGASMIQASAGSGKTMSLSARIAHMLNSDSIIEPHNILCLTFTDTGATAMRQRLLKIIGTEAYKVTIATFHSFANEVIQNNLAYFGIRDMEPVSRLEQISITEGIIDSLDYNHPLKRLTGLIYFEVKRLLYTWELMQKEDWSFEYIKTKTEEYIADMKYDEEFIYKRGNAKRGIEKGDFNANKAKGVVEKLEKFIAAAGLFDIYQQAMKRAKRYSFNDMISWVVNAFRDNENILLDYQERFQYVLLDEFQDSSGAQLSMVNLLMSYWENPNLMCVLDRKQTIYSFANARIQNIKDTSDLYNPNQVTFNKNYRSTQGIVDACYNLISNAKDGTYDPDEIIQGMNPDSGAIEVRRYSNFMQETAYVAEEIMSRIDDGVDPSKIAVIYRKHSHADDLLKILRHNNIPISTKRKVDVLENSVTKQLLSILQYLISPEKGEKSDLFFVLLHFNFFGVNRRQIERLLILLRGGKTITDLDARSFKTVNNVITILEDAENTMHNGSLLQLMMVIYYKTGIKDLILNDKDKEAAACLKSFFNFITEECEKNPELDVAELLQLIRRMKSNNVSLQLEDLISSENGVFFTTAHGAKGEERKYVYMIRSNRSDWEKARAVNNSYFMPPTVTKEFGDVKEEEGRRLFFVAMSRAETDLYVSFSEKDTKGKDMEPSQFVLESQIPITEIEEVDTLPSLNLLLAPDVIRFNPQVEEEKIDAILENFRMSPSSLNQYLKCPLSFYYERVLRVPYVQSYPAVYGSACHYAVEKAYFKYKEAGYGVDVFVEDAISHMERYGAHLSNKERGQMVNAIRRILPEFYQNYFIGSKKIVKCEWKVKDVVINDVPCYGEIDKLEFEGTICDITDYKTGKPENVKKKMNPATAEDIGGDVWRQLVFYRLLVKETATKNWEPRKLSVVTIGKEPKELVMEYDNSYSTIVKNQIKEAYTNIMNKKFDGCGDPECKWCSVVK